MPYAEENAPTKVVTTDSARILVNYELIDALIIDDDLYTGSKWLRIPTFGLSVEEGTPSLPVRIETFELPVGCDSVTITKRFGPAKDFSIELTPSRPYLIDSSDEIWTKSNVKPVRYSAFKGTRDIIKIVGYVKYRGRTRVNIQISPVQYELSSKTVRIYPKFSFRVNFIKKATSSGIQAKAYASVKPPIYRDSIIGPIQSGDSINPTPITDNYAVSSQPQYAVITTPKYLTAAKTFAEHKSVLGYNMFIYSKNYWTEKQVKDSLQKFYNENDNPMFALIIGGHKDVPGKKIRYNSQHRDTISYTDYQYACMDGPDDMVQDIYIGRIPVKTLNEANIVINKIKAYEMTPPVSTKFYQTGLHVAFFEKYNKDNSTNPLYSQMENARFVRTSEEIRDYMLMQGKNVERIYTTDCPCPKYWNPQYGKEGEIPQELQDPNFYNFNTQDIVNSFNAGRFYILHRDHGQINGWYQPAFHNYDVVKLTNKNKLPVIFSINCQSGNFADSNGNTDCFAEKVLKHENGGSVAVIASSHLSYSGINDNLCLSMFDAMWPDPGIIENNTIEKSKVYRLGEILERGKKYIKAANSYYPEQVKMTFDRFHIFGDPSMMIRTDVPVNFNENEYSINGMWVNFKDPVYIAVKDSVKGTSTLYYGKRFMRYGQTITKKHICIYGPDRIPYQFEYGLSIFGSNSNNEISLATSNDNSINQLSITYTLPETSEYAEIQIHNILTGAPMDSHRVSSDDSSLEIDTSSYDSGYYVVNMQSEDGQTAQGRFAVVK